MFIFTNWLLDPNCKILIYCFNYEQTGIILCCIVLYCITVTQQYTDVEAINKYKYSSTTAPLQIIRSHLSTLPKSWASCNFGWQFMSIYPTSDEPKDIIGEDD